MSTLDVQLSKVFSSLKAPCDSLSGHSEFNYLHYNLASSISSND